MRLLSYVQLISYDKSADNIDRISHADVRETTIPTIIPNI